MTRISPTSPNPMSAAEPRMTRARTNSATVFSQLDLWKSNLRNLNAEPLTKLFEDKKPKLDSRPSSSREWSDLSESNESSEREVSESESESIAASEQSDEDSLSIQEAQDSTSIDAQELASASSSEDASLVPKDAANLEETGQPLRRTDKHTLASIMAEEKQQEVLSSNPEERALPASSSMSTGMIYSSELNDDQNLNSDAKKEKRRCCSHLFRSVFSKV